MFGSKKVADDAWAAAMAEVSQAVRPDAARLGEAAVLVGNDPLSGWISCTEFLNSLDELKQRASRLKQLSKSVGEPSSSPDLKQARSLFMSFFDSVDLAVHWGKHHIKDASGGPGLRALTETGFAQRAATTRVTNNGVQFATFAARAAKDGRLACDTVQAHTTAYRPGAPSLADLFVAATGVEISRQPLRSEVAMVASWCFRQGAVLGMLLSDAPSSALPAVWDPTRANVFVQRVREWSAELLGDGSEPRILGMPFLVLQFPEVFSTDIRPGESFDRAMRRRTEAAQTKLSLADANSEWSIATAMGYGLGVWHPEAVDRALLTEEQGIDESTWKEAHAAGLDVPAEQPALSRQDQIDGVIDLCRPYLRQHYPDAFAVIERYG